MAPTPVPSSAASSPARTDGSNPAAERPDAPPPHAWRAADLADDGRWVVALDDDDVAQLERALAVARATGKGMLALDPADFPLGDALRARLRDAVDRTQTGLGLAVMRGLPVGRWRVEDARLAYWGLGLHVGVARTQGRASHAMSDVRDEGLDYRGRDGRGYNTSAELDFHADFCDLVGLLCLADAREGGDTVLVSSIAVHDHIAATRPDLLEVLYRPFGYSLQGAGAPGGPEWFPCPIFGVRDGRFACRCNRKNVIAAQQRFADVPRLTPEQIEALDLLDATIARPELRFTMRMRPGDLQWLNNHVILHSRTAFVDHDDPARRRHLLRLWLALPEGHALPEGWRPGYGAVTARTVRGGLRGSAIGPDFLDYERRLAAHHRMALAT